MNWGIFRSLANKLLDASLSNNTYTPPATVYIALCTAPVHQEDTIITEVSGGNYARQPVTFANAAAGFKQSNNTVVFPTPAGDWGNAASPIVAQAIMDHLTNNSGNGMYFQNICPRIVLTNSTPPTYPTKGFSISLHSEDD